MLRRRPGVVKVKGLFSSRFCHQIAGGDPSEPESKKSTALAPLSGMWRWGTSGAVVGAVGVVVAVGALLAVLRPYEPRRKKLAGGQKDRKHSRRFEIHEERSVRVKGLRNRGNSCFFNAVLQVNRTMSTCCRLCDDIYPGFGQLA